MSLSAQEPKMISDCTINFKVTVEDAKADPAVIKAMSETTKTLYVKGARSRIDLETPNFKQIMIYDSKSDSTIILRELGNNKYISYLDGVTRKDKNKKYEGITFTETNERKRILNYDCNKVVARLIDGSTYEVYYTPSIIPSVTGYEYQFNKLPGLVLEYEAVFERGKTKVRFEADKVDMIPVPVAKFDVPKAGYRVL
jgi:GLPGLI family protein